MAATRGGDHSAATRGDPFGDHFPTQPIRVRRTPARSRLLIAVAVVVAVIAALGYQAWPATSGAPRSDRAAGKADGAVPDGVTVFDDEFPAVAELDPGLLKALRRAAKDAGRAGVTIYVTSGWRSRDYQDQLLREAVGRYGTAEEAARWVATPDTSRHVSGDAVDVGPAEATAWLSRRGAAYGLCQIYRNEPWHFELRPDAARRGCPRPYADPTHDPRMHK